MIVLGSAKRAEETRHCRTLATGFSFHRSEWLESGRDGAMSPTVFLVEQPPHSVLDPHFHAQNQFQVVKQGSGTLGPHAVGPGSVATDAYRSRLRRRETEGGAKVEEALAAEARRTTLQRLTTVDDVAKAVVFLASDLASGVSGQILPVGPGTR